MKVMEIVAEVLEARGVMPRVSPAWVETTYCEARDGDILSYLRLVAVAWKTDVLRSPMLKNQDIDNINRCRHLVASLEPLFRDMEWNNESEEEINELLTGGAKEDNEGQETNLYGLEGRLHGYQDPFEIQEGGDGL